MIRHHVVSSTIRAITYVPEQETLDVEFIRGPIYRYLAVPTPTFASFLEAESKGAYFNHHIRDRFEFRQVLSHE